MRDKERGVVWE